MSQFLRTVRSLGVSLNVYKVGDKWEWTSLLGGEKRFLLYKLPENFERFLPPSKVETTRNLWTASINLTLGYFCQMLIINIQLCSL